MDDSYFFLRDKRSMMSFLEKNAFAHLYWSKIKTKEKSSIQKYRESASFDLYLNFNGHFY